MFRLYFAILAAAALVACGSDQEQSAQPLPEVKAEAAASLDPAKGIDWFEGSVEDAFATAKQSGKPIYLYWGAVWCPPCHAISATIFKSPEFLERSKLFVPVYLDGDTENAQAYGEKFGVRGYPTMIVFDSEGVELTRIPGGIDLQAYANVLDLTLNHASSARDLVAGFSAGTDSLAPTDCTLLAYYSWGQDTTILGDADATATFRSMYEACPANMAVERSILYFGWLDKAIAAATAEEDAVPLSDAQKSEALLNVEALLADDDLINANIFTILFSGVDYVKALTGADSDKRDELMISYDEVFDRIAANESVYTRERIYTLIGKIEFERIDDEEAELSSQLQSEIREMVQWADETTPSVYERQPIINALGNVLDEAGMDEDAKTLLVAELEISKTPYYFMVSLADIEQRAGNTDAAVDWFRRAYESTTGSATRFQWGYYYLNGLLEMTPEDTQLIHDTTVGLVSELQNSGGLYQRPKAQLGRLENNLVTWGEENDRAAELAEIRSSVVAVCASASHQDESRATCDAFLEAS
ncbi:MAG: thioredoxin family protein [Woeseiaceae bacterium]|nr:thioredoxin family protein [Woeseiaceae bacterium]MDX2609184.1 thioredoxin family protein [Woeseiaceae bacterium]